MKPRSYFLFFLLLAPVSAQVGLGLSPMRVELKLAPGAMQSGALDLVAEPGSRVRARGELLDFSIDESMTPQFARNLPAESANSCRNWLTVNPMEPEIEGGQRVLVRYTIRVPADAADRSYYCAVGFTAMPPADQPASTGIRTTVRVVAAFYVVVGKPASNGELSGLSLEHVPASGGPDVWRVVVRVRNNGDLHLRPQGKVRLYAAEGKLVEELTLPSFPALPHREQRYLIPLTSSRGAEVRSLEAEVDPGLNEVHKATVAVEPGSVAR